MTASNDSALSPRSTTLAGVLLALLAFALYAVHDAIIKYLGGSYSPVQIVFFSVLLGFPFATTVLVTDRTDANLRPRHPWWMALRTGAAVLSGLCGFYAFGVLPLAQVYAILFAMPLLITILSIPVLGEPVGPRRWMAVICGLIGVMVVVRPSSAALELGHAAALTSAVCSAIAAVIVRKIGQEERSMVLLLYPMLANFMVMGGALGFFYRPMPVEDFAGLGAIAALAFVATLCIIAAYRKAEAAIVAPMQYSQILWAVLFGLMFFDERPDFWTVVGATIIIASGLYIVLRERSGGTSENRPVLAGRSRPETATFPRPRLPSMMHVPGRGSSRMKQFDRD